MCLQSRPPAKSAKRDVSPHKGGGAAKSGKAADQAALSCVIVATADREALKRSAVQLKELLADRRVDAQMTLLRPDEALRDVLNECRADGVVTAAVLYTPRSAPQTLDVHVLQGQREGCATVTGCVAFGALGVVDAIQLGRGVWRS